MGEFRRPRGSDPVPTRSVRVPDEVWQPADVKAKAEGVTPSYVVNVLLKGYLDGSLTLPQTQLVYPVSASGPHQPK